MNEKDSSKWSDIIKTLSPVPSAFISALGTTRGQAGSFEAQRKIDYDLNLSLAQAARESGVRLYVLISSGGVSTSSLAPYPRMKAELEDAVKDLKFPHTIILKPGLLMGAREDSRPPEAVFRGIAKVLGAVSKGYLTYWWSQDADVVGRAAISAALQCAEGKKGEGVWLVGQSEIIRLGQTEWKGNI